MKEPDNKHDQAVKLVFKDGGITRKEFRFIRRYLPLWNLRFKYKGLLCVLRSFPPRSEDHNPTTHLFMRTSKYWYCLSVIPAPADWGIPLFTSGGVRDVHSHFDGLEKICKIRKELVAYLKTCKAFRGGLERLLTKAKEDGL